ncbi:excisionase family DNA-binding protein [Amycolatopsis japonica]|uniref:excisionase family DNA-binding protein n=1 Tax=Amycolatopsis japonica TaxID=208439 RepID=UPI0033DEBDA9
MKFTTRNLFSAEYTRALTVSPNEDQGALLTVKEACDTLRVSKWTLYHFIHTRQLATVKLRSRRLIRRSAIRELVKKLEIEAVT